MKLTRKQLNQILLGLPNPRLVEEGKIPTQFKVPIFKELSLVTSDIDFRYSVNDCQLTFEYSYKYMDWYLVELDV